MTHSAPPAEGVTTPPTPYYSDDLVTLYHGDCREQTAWLEADVLVTDPPYGIGLRLEFGSGRCTSCGKPSRSRSGTCRDCRPLTKDSFVRPIAGDATTEVRDEVLQAWGPSRPAVVFGTWKAPRPTGTRQVLIWDKSHNGPGMGDLSSPWGLSHEEIYVLGAGFVGKRTGSVIRAVPYNSQSADRPDHPTPKPVRLLAPLIERCPSGAIADPFVGSGSTLVAAKGLGRHAIGVEIEEQYCEIAARRLSQDTLFGGVA